MEYIFDDLILLSFWGYIYSDLSPKKRYKYMNWVCLVMMAASIMSVILNFIFERYFYIDQNGVLIEDSSIINSEILNYLIFLIIGILIIQSKRKLSEKLILLSFEVFPVIAFIATDLRFSYSVQNISFLLSVVLIYINIYQGRKKKIVEQENRLTQQNMALMISQIQPHFLYNTLTTISNLCVKDPEQAEETTIMFSQYLRGNLDSLRITEPVHCMKELDHIRIYVELEQRRFGVKLNVIYDIQDTSSNPNELVASYVDVSYIAFENIFLRGNVSDLEIIHLVGDTATVTLDNSKLYSLFLAHLGDDGKIDTSTMSYSTLSGFNFTGNTTSYTLTGAAYVCAYIALFFFIILGLTTIMRRRLQHTRAKMEAAGRLYPQGYGRCTLCGAIVLPGEGNCRKCGAYIDRPESMKPRKKDYLTCSVCGAEITEDMTECPKCGAKFDGEESVVTHVDGSQETSVEMMVCPVCNKHIPATSERCTYCGKKFDE